MYSGPVVSVVHYRSKGLYSRPIYESLCKNVFCERLDLECLSSCRRRNEFQQVIVGQPELQKYWILRGIPPATGYSCSSPFKEIKGEVTIFDTRRQDLTSLDWRRYKF